MHSVAPQTRYRAAEHDEDGPNTAVPMFVYDEQDGGPEAQSYLGPKFTRAEAEIIAFALNAVASGRSLSATEHTPGFDPTVFDTYAGPTEGVAGK